MKPLLLLALATALTAPLGDEAGDLETPGDHNLTELGLENEVQARASTSGVNATVSPDDLGLYLEAALPGPGFSLPVEEQPEVDSHELLTGEGAQAQDGWGPAVPVAMPEPSEAAIPAGLAVLGAAAYAAARLRYIGPWFLVPLYSRLSRSDLLENETRSKLIDIVEAEPGLSLQELAKRSGAGWGTTVYHLQRLEQAGFLKSEKQGHHRRFYKVGEVGKQEIEALGMLRNDTPRKIAQYLVQDPGCNQKAICEALDISPSLAHKYLKRLEDQQLVSTQREWRSKHYTPAENLSMLIEQAA